MTLGKKQKISISYVTYLPQEYVSIYFQKGWRGWQADVDMSVMSVGHSQSSTEEVAWSWKV